jgi:hypothetical protein
MNINHEGEGLGSETTQYILMNDISLTTTTASIGSGSAGNAFQGRFYGNGKTISINRFLTSGSGTTSTNSYSGLFGYLQGSSTNPADIRDLEVVYTNASFAEATNIGGIVGRASYANIINCLVRAEGDIELRNINRGQNIGGIAGFLSNSNINNCYNALSFNIERDDTVNVGGIIGNLSALTTTNSINNCISIYRRHNR